MSRTTTVLAALLGVSVLLNILTLHRLSSIYPQTEAAPRRPDPTPRATPDPEIEELRAEIERLKRELAAARTKPGPVTPANPTYVSPRASRGPKKVTDIWTELETLRASKDNVEESLYMQNLFGATASYLELDDAERGRFLGTARVVHMNVVQAEVQKAQSLQAGQPADIVEAAYKQQITAAADLLRSSLDGSKKKNETFCLELAKWFGYFKIPGR